MQQSAVPELAHTQTRPIHWVATATAVAGVVALSSLVQPGSATAASATGTQSKSAPVAAQPPSTTGVDFPLQCGRVKPVVAKKATGDLDGDGRPETVAVVHCDSAMGTPPDGVYVLTRGADNDTPRIVATLVEPKDRLTVTDFTLHAGTVGATLLGYSSAAVPNCCPDLRTPVTWKWSGNAFVRSTPTDAHSV